MKFITLPLLLLIICALILSGARAEYSLVKDLLFILKSLNVHNSFDYINQNSLPESYHENVMSSKNDDAVYLLLSDTKTPASRFLSHFTNNRFNHISLSFDAGFKTIVSYNGGNNRFFPGLNPETLSDLLPCRDSRVLVYRLPLLKEQKLGLYERVSNINNEGSSYNIIGVVTRKSFQPNIMYCSQFIYTLLEEQGARYFSINDNNTIRPSDFIELDYKRKLEFYLEMQGSIILEAPSLQKEQVPNLSGLEM